MSEDKPFDRRLRRLRRDRAAPRFADADYLHRLAADELLHRLSGVTRTFTTALDLGCWDGYVASRLREMGIEATCADPGRRFAEDNGGVRADEDRLPFGDAVFDLVISVGVLDSVNDLPGALALIRRTLVPDGLFLGAFIGAGSLPQLRSAMGAADAATGAAAPRIHPQIDIRAAGDLLTRAGFKLQVADGDAVDVRFPSLMALIRDLRAMGATNIIGTRSKAPITRYGLAAALSDFQEQADTDGKTAERFEIIYLTGWAPSPAQPRPAARGSATASLAAALGDKAR